MFDELRKFKEREGHCKVPRNYTDNPKLGTWVQTQREMRLKISKERASKLDSIGFTWGIKLDDRWEIMFEELRKFKEREGHCNVPSRYSDNLELGNWVSHQRRRRLKISKETASKLDSIGFTWDRNPDVRWEIMFEELRKFKEREGHCNVPSRFSDNPELGRWVKKQRGQISKISNERASKLDSIGFTWGIKPNARWEIRFEELRKFKEREGHCNVPGKYSDNPELGIWVKRQRGQRFKMTKERALQLDSIGFTWVVNIEPDVRWEIMFEELRKFKEREGNCNVPSSYSDNPELGRWVSRQRVQISKISNRRASKLDSIGFTWGIKRPVKREIRFEELRRFKER